jgi:hypothetical protein
MILRVKLLFVDCEVLIVEREIFTYPSIIINEEKIPGLTNLGQYLMSPVTREFVLFLTTMSSCMGYFIRQTHTFLKYVILNEIYRVYYWELSQHFIILFI